MQHDERGQIFVHRAEPVGEPRAHRGFAVLHRAGVDELVGRLVVDGVGLHRADEAEVVAHLRDVRQQFADPHPALPVLRKLEDRRRERKRRLARGHPGEALALVAEVGLEVFPEAGLERGLVVEEVELRGRADQRDVDRSLGLGRDFPRLRHRGAQRVRTRRTGRNQPRSQQRRKSGDAETRAGGAEELPAGERGIVSIKRDLPVGREGCHDGYLVSDSSRFST